MDFLSGICGISGIKGLKIYFLELPCLRLALTRAVMAEGSDSAAWVCIEDFSPLSLRARMPLEIVGFSTLRGNRRRVPSTGRRGKAIV